MDRAEFKAMLQKMGWSVDMRQPLSKYSPDLHQVIEHSHARALEAFQQWLYWNPGVKTTKIYKDKFEALFKEQCTKEIIAADVQRLPKVYQWVKDHHGDWAPRSVAVKWLLYFSARAAARDLPRARTSRDSQSTGSRSSSTLAGACASPATCKHVLLMLLGSPRPCPHAHDCVIVAAAGNPSTRMLVSDSPKPARKHRVAGAGFCKDIKRGLSNYND